MARTATKLRTVPRTVSSQDKAQRKPTRVADVAVVEPAAQTAAPSLAVADLFETVDAATAASPASVSPSESLPPLAQSSPVDAPSEARPARGKAKGPTLKAGVGLKMVMPDGEESIVPFKSVEDLLSGIKPYLRDAARSPEPVWFCLEKIDLANFDPEG